MFVEIFLEIGRAFNIVFVRSLQTSGDVMFPTILAIIFCWVVAVFGSFLFGSYTFLGLGLVGIWISMAIDECSRAVIFIFRWRSGKWKNIILLVIISKNANYFYILYIHYFLIVVKYQW